MPIFRGAYNSLRNQEYYDKLANEVKNILGSNKTINLNTLKEQSSIFQKIDTCNQGNIKEIMNLDGDANSLSEEELMVLLILADGNKNMEYDGEFSLNKDCKVNNCHKSSIHSLYESIKIRNGKGTSNLNVTGKIGPSMQIGNNCWMLSQFNGYSQTDFGSEIITNSIKKDELNKTYTVCFDGDNKSYTYSEDEIISAKKTLKYVNTDDTTTLLEMAFEDLFADLEAENYVKIMGNLEEKIKYNPNNNTYTVNVSWEDVKVTAEELRQNNIDSNNEEIIKYAYKKQFKKNGMHGASMLEYSGDVLFHFTGKEYNISFGENDDPKKDLDNIDYFLKLKAKNPKHLVIFFNSSYDIEEDGIDEYDEGGHVYYVSDVKLDNKGNVKSVAVNDPHVSGKNIYLSYNKFLKCSSFKSPLEDDAIIRQFYGGTDINEIREELLARTSD